MVIHNLHLVGIPLLPGKTDAPLVVDAYAELAFSFTFQNFQSIAWRNPQVGQGPGVVEHTQLTPGHGLNVLWQSPGDFSAPNNRCFIASETLDQSIPSLVI
jgi:hypothetical protein